ncbi:uncharacterized protein BYT42DRAFT_258981 [Radiomyces spectabilis]|uniref:uncharacterized protein n=1 Tax=Radiomyces spectabilis TaxID=64574 RepID=UPI00221E7B61|nr:uncharacterized protein BYT42DRAFT_258981 [Radiomyces spectabilis]KAI8384384.1 hypothetical protein BYT42DRAFT_258981 [Radiomyces spectabilis]
MYPECPHAFFLVDTYLLSDNDAQLVSSYINLILLFFVQFICHNVTLGLHFFDSSSESSPLAESPIINFKEESAQDVQTEFLQAIKSARSYEIGAPSSTPRFSHIQSALKQLVDSFPVHSLSYTSNQSNPTASAYNCIYIISKRPRSLQDLDIFMHGSQQALQNNNEFQVTASHISKMASSLKDLLGDKCRKHHASLNWIDPTKFESTIQPQLIDSFIEYGFHSVLRNIGGRFVPEQVMQVQDDPESGVFSGFFANYISKTLQQKPLPAILSSRALIEEEDVARLLHENLQQGRETGVHVTASDYGSPSRLCAATLSSTMPSTFPCLPVWVQHTTTLDIKYVLRSSDIESDWLESPDLPAANFALTGQPENAGLIKMNQYLKSHEAVLLVQLKSKNMPDGPLAIVAPKRSNEGRVTLVRSSCEPSLGRLITDTFLFYIQGKGVSIEHLFDAVTSSPRSVHEEIFWSRVTAPTDVDDEDVDDQLRSLTDRAPSVYMRRLNEYEMSSTTESRENTPPLMDSLYDEEETGARGVNQSCSEHDIATDLNTIYYEVLYQEMWSLEKYMKWITDYMRHIFQIYPASPREQVLEALVRAIQSRTLSVGEFDSKYCETEVKTENSPYDYYGREEAKFFKDWKNANTVNANTEDAEASLLALKIRDAKMQMVLFMCLLELKEYKARRRKANIKSEKRDQEPDIDANDLPKTYLRMHWGQYLHRVLMWIGTSDIQSTLAIRDAYAAAYGHKRLDLCDMLVDIFYSNLQRHFFSLPELLHFMGAKLQHFEKHGYQKPEEDRRNLKRKGSPAVDPRPTVKRATSETSVIRDRISPSPNRSCTRSSQTASAHRSRNRTSRSATGPHSTSTTRTHSRQPNSPTTNTNIIQAPNSPSANGSQSSVQTTSRQQRLPTIDTDPIQSHGSSSSSSAGSNVHTPIQQPNSPDPSIIYNPMSTSPSGSTTTPTFIPSQQQSSTIDYTTYPQNEASLTASGFRSHLSHTLPRRRASMPCNPSGVQHGVSPESGTSKVIKRSQRRNSWPIFPPANLQTESLRRKGKQRAWFTVPQRSGFSRHVA